MEFVVNKIFHLAWTDIRIEFSERSTLVFFLILPIVFTAILGNAMTGPPADADNRLILLLTDEDETALSAELIAALNSSAIARPVSHERAEAERLLVEDDMPGLLIIPAGFEAALLAGEGVEMELQTAVADNRAIALEQAVNNAAGQISAGVLAAQASVEAAEQIRPFADDTAQATYFNASLTMAQERLQNPPVAMSSNRAVEISSQAMGGFELASAGQLVTWTLITLIGASSVLVNERLGGTLRRLLVTPTQKATILAGKIVGWLGMGLLQMGLLIGVGALIFGVDWGNSPAALILVVVTFGLAAVAFGLMLGALARTRSQASGLTTLFAMLMAALGGAWWPLEITPTGYQTAVQILPTTWAMKGFTGVIARGHGVAEVLPVAGVLLLFAVVFFGVGLWRFRYE
jgi:ABC-2 type transport system permease protein